MILQTAALATIISGMAFTSEPVNPGDPAGWDRLMIGAKCIYTDDTRKQVRCFFAANTAGAALITREAKLADRDKVAAEFCLAAGYPATWTASALDFAASATSLSVRSLTCESPK